MTLAGTYIRRPLKNLWHRNSAPNKKTCSFAALIPAEIILEIANYIDRPKDILNFGLQSRLLLPLMLPLLYATLTLQSNTTIRKALGLFLRRPELAKHVRELTLRLNHTKEVPRPAGGPLDEILVAEIIERLASQGNLKGLTSFVWDGLEGPKDRLWITLKKSCPLLNSVGSSIGLRVVNPNSHLYNFSDLLSFSLVIKWRDSRSGHILEEVLPEALWKMLTLRCPNLQHLTLGGPSPLPLARIFDVRPLMAARWPALRSLTLGDVKVQQSAATHTQDSAAFSLFLQEHPTLESLTLHRVGAFVPASLGLPRSALPRLTFLSGTLYHVHDLPNPAKLKTLCLTSTHYTSFFLYDLLKTLSSLTSLSIWIDLSQIHHHPPSGDHGALFHSILVTCPALEHLEILCSTHISSTFSYKELSNALNMRPSRLQNLSITKLPHPSDSKQLTKTASMLAVENPNLCNITLRRACEQWSVPGKTLCLMQVGAFLVIKNVESVPVGLVVDEWRVGFLGRGRKVVKRYKCGLPAHGSE